MVAVYETTVSERGRPDWEQEVCLAVGGSGGVVHRPSGYQAPHAMRWDGVHGRPDAVAQGDLFCFVMSAWKPVNQPAEMAVYRVTRTLGRTHGDHGVLAARLTGRPGWTDRLSAAIELRCVGFVRRDRFCAACARGQRSPQRTQVCKGVVPGSVLATLDVHAVAPAAASAPYAAGAGAAAPASAPAPVPLTGAPPTAAAAASAASAASASMSATSTWLPQRQDRRSRAEKATGWGGPSRRKRRRSAARATATTQGSPTAAAVLLPKDTIVAGGRISPPRADIGGSGISHDRSKKPRRRSESESDLATSMASRSASKSTGPELGAAAAAAASDTGGAPVATPKQPQPPGQYCCPVTLTLMVDPVILASGHTYEREFATNWIEGKERNAEAPTDPMTNLELESNAIVPNIALRQSIDLWKQEHARGV